MAHVTMDDYTNIYVGSCEISADDWPALAERASDIIDELTCDRITEGYADLPAWIQKRIIKATCAQIEHLWMQGIENAVSGGSEGSYRIGSTSITKSAANSAATGAGARVSVHAVKLLEPTGLMYRGIDTLC